jgi:hypothetical protein
MRERTRALIQRYLALDRRVFTTSHVNGWAVLAVLLVPAVIWPLLPPYDFVKPIVISLWLFFGGGLTGVYLLDVSRRRSDSESTFGQLFRWSARAFVVSLGLAGSAAGVLILFRLANDLRFRSLPLRLLVFGSFLGGGLVVMGIHLVHQSFQRRVQR